MPLTEENLGLHNGDFSPQPSDDPIINIKARITNTLKNLSKLGPEGQKTILECDVFEDGSTVSYRGSDRFPQPETFEFWQDQWITLDAKFQHISRFFNLRWDRDNKNVLKQRGSSYDKGNVNPWVIATSCKVEVPADAIWYPPGPAPYAKMHAEQEVPIPASIISAQAATSTKLSSSESESQQQQQPQSEAVAEPANTQDSSPPTLLRRSQRVASLKRDHDQITS